jgi:putative transposase
MPRSSRILLPNAPHHIVQRGHNRQVVFVSDDDYNYYRENLIFFKKEFGCRVYAYCLMTNHVHLVLEPGDEPEAISLLMKRVAGRQTRHVNKLEKRSGSLWEGRFKSSIISSTEYLAACCRYVELNPLRAGMVADPGEYKWSSFNRKAKGKRDPVVDLPVNYMSLGKNARERQEMYSEYVSGTVPEYELKLIRDALQRGQVTGGEKFRHEVSRKLGIRISNRGPGRPKKGTK